MKNRIIITGPTASGKTSLSIALAQTLNGEIISVDSRQCFRHLDIGTAKPFADELANITHHNISVLDLEQKDTVADFLIRANRYKELIEKKGKQVIYCGGSTLHLQSLIRPMDNIPPADPENIDSLNRQADESGLESLFQLLKKTDPVYAKKMDGMNRQRIIRALDVWQQTGKPFSSFHSNKPFELPGNFHAFAIHHNRAELHRRITNRTQKMLDMGLLDEVRELLRKGYSPELQAFNTVGYRQVISHLSNEYSYEYMYEKIKTETRRYAKRQLTWLRRLSFLHWLDMDTMNETDALNEILTRISQ